MLQEELVNLVSQVQTQKSESNTLEFKSAFGGCPKLYDTFSSFSNQTGGGIILFGIDEKNNYQICGVYDAADLQKKISEQSLQMEPVLRPLCTVADIDGKIVVSAEIQELELARRPCFYKGAGRIRGSYVRVGDADLPMSEYEVYSYEAYRKKIQDELRYLERTTLEDIDTDMFAEYLFHLRKSKPNLAELSSDKIQKLQGFVVDTKPTLAGILLFSDYPQAYVPQLCITAVVVQGTEIGDTGTDSARFIDNARFEGTIPQLLEQTNKFVRRNMSVKTIIDPNTGNRIDRTQYPIVAIREILLNALIHRDYSIHTDTAPIMLILYTDRLVLENPGGLYGRLTLDTLGKISADTRNPFIAGAMEVLGETENRFSGIPTIRKSMDEIGLPAPVFELIRGVFRVTLYNSTVSAIDSSMNFIQSSLDMQILAFCKEPRNRKDLTMQFSQLTPTYLFSNYINPLVASGKLALSIPDKPKSKNQMYFSI